MTTIACNKQALYGDLQFTNGSYKYKGSGKVFRFKASPIWHCDYIVGFAGTASAMLDVAEFFANPSKSGPRVKDLFGLVLTAEREIYRFDNYRRWLKVEDKFSAIGSGMDYAMGAMATGATPKEAVKVAMTHDIYSGMGIKGYEI